MTPLAWHFMTEELGKIAQFSQSQFSTPIEGPKPTYQASAQGVSRKPAPAISVKMAQFATSQFSGPLSMGKFKQESSMPPMTMQAPSVKAAPSSGLSGVPNPAAAAPQMKMAAGYGATITHVSSPMAVLGRTQRVGQAKITPPPGPSIAEQVKPENLGKGSPVGPNLPGAGKLTSGV